MDDGIQFDMVFNSDLFDRARMIELLEQIRLVLRQAAADGEVKLSAIDLASVAHRERAARRVATVDEAVSELRASSGDLAGVGRALRDRRRRGTEWPAGALLARGCGDPACDGDTPITSPRSLRRRMPRAIVNGVNALAEARGRSALVGWTAAVAALFAKVEDATQLRVRRSDDRRQEQDSTQPVELVSVGIKDDPSFGNSSMPSAPSWKALRTYLVPMKAHSELEEQPRRGRIPVIEWLDETVNALNDETPFRLRFLAVGDELDVELDWQEGSGTSLRAACLLDQLEHLAEQLVIDGNGKISAADLVPVAHRSKLPDIGQLLNTVPLESVPQMLALAAEAHPLRSAVEHGTRSWSYGKFDEVVRRIAGALYAAGARRCDVIAVTGERSCALVASMAAVLRAGGVLLCLDQNLPAGRRELMLREAKVCAILVIERPTCPRSPMGPFLPSITKGCRLSQPIRYPPQTFQLATLRPTSSSPLERPVCRRGAGRACRPVALHRMAAKGVRHWFGRSRCSTHWPVVRRRAARCVHAARKRGDPRYPRQ